MCASFPKGPICTRTSLAAELRAAGVKCGGVLLLHSSLRSLGWVCGSAEAVVSALLDVLGEAGTLVVPTQTSDNSDPKEWQHPPVPEEWWPIIRENTPAYDPRISRSRGMGAIAEAARTWPGAVRSDHPQTSFAAVGPLAESLMSGHSPDCRLGEKSPLAKLEAIKAQVLLLGAGFDSCTAFHLAEYRVFTKFTDNSFAIATPAGRKWATVRDIDIAGDFEKLGADFVQDSKLEATNVGGAKVWLFGLEQAVAYAQRRLPELHGANSARMTAES